jgi:hypothetical protein
MGQPKQFVFEYKELAELMVKQQDLHEGHWGIYLEFGLQGTNVQDEGKEKMLPAALLMVSRIGLQRFDTETPLSVDAAIINPKTK